jgi:hypothetical protein
VDLSKVTALRETALHALLTPPSLSTDSIRSIAGSICKVPDEKLTDKALKSKSKAGENSQRRSQRRRRRANRRLELMKLMMQRMYLIRKLKPKQALPSQSPWLKILFPFVLDYFAFSCKLLWMVKLMWAMITVWMLCTYTWISFMSFKCLSSSTFAYTLASSVIFLYLVGMLCSLRSLSIHSSLPYESLSQ